MKKFFFDCGTRDGTASLGLFVLRVSAGLMMLLGHGLPKLHAYQAMLDSGKWRSPAIWPFEHLNPNISLICAIGAEVVGSALLVLGLLTRPAAFMLGFTMVVAAFYAHAQGTWFNPGNDHGAKELALLYLLPCVVLILSGAGAWSFDAALYREGKRKRW
ncbi:MAG: DoxX family protein [Luteolibacter sp.]